MSWTGHNANELGYWIQKVNDLGNEEKEQCFGEMAKDSNDSKDHSWEIAEDVSNKDLAGVLISFEESNGSNKIGDH